MKSNTYRTALLISASVALAVLASNPSTRIVARSAASAGAQPAAPLRHMDEQGLVETYGKVPLSFEANRGQTDPRVKFISGGSGYTLFLTGDEAVLSLRSQKPGVRSQESEVRSQKHEGRPWSLVPGHLQRTRDSAQKTKDKGLGTSDVLRMKLVGA